MILKFNTIIFNIIFIYNIFLINSSGIIFINFDLDNDTYTNLTKQYKSFYKYTNPDDDISSEWYHSDKNFNNYIFSTDIGYNKDKKLHIDLYYDEKTYFSCDYLIKNTKLEKEYLGKNYVIDKKDNNKITVKKLTTSNLKYDENILKDDYIYYIPKKIIEEIKNHKVNPIYTLLQTMYIKYFNELQKEVFNIDEDETKNLPFKITYKNGDIYIECIPKNFKNLIGETEKPVYTLKFKPKDKDRFKIPNDYINIEEYENIIENFKYEYKNYKKLNKKEIKYTFLKSLKNNGNKILKEIGEKALVDDIGGKTLVDDIDIYDTTLVSVNDNNPLPSETLYINIHGIFIKEETYKNIENFKKDMEEILKELSNNKEENIEKLYEIAKKAIESLKKYNIQDYANQKNKIGIDNTLEKCYHNEKGTGIYETIIRTIFLKIIKNNLKAPEEKIKKLEEITKFNYNIKENFPSKKITITDKEITEIKLSIKHAFKKIYDEILENIGENENFFSNNNILSYDDNKYPYYFNFVKESDQEETKDFRKYFYTLNSNIDMKIYKYERSIKNYLKVNFDKDNSIDFQESIVNDLNKLSRFFDNDLRIADIDSEIEEEILNQRRWFREYHNYDFEFRDKDDKILDKNFIIPKTTKTYEIKLKIIRIEKNKVKKKNIMKPKIDEINSKKNDSINHEKENIKEKNKVKKKNIMNHKIDEINSKKNDSINYEKENITEKNNLHTLIETDKINKTSKITKNTTDTNILNINTRQNNNNNSNNVNGNKCRCCSCCRKT